MFHGLAGHSKGGNDVLLYASIYDDIPKVINIAGRLYMDRGIKERFGDGIMDEVRSTGFKTMKSRRSDGTEISWQLTPEVRGWGHRDHQTLLNVWLTCQCCIPGCVNVP